MFQVEFFSRKPDRNAERDSIMHKQILILRNELLFERYLRQQYRRRVGLMQRDVISIETEANEKQALVIFIFIFFYCFFYLYLFIFYISINLFIYLDMIYIFNLYIYLYYLFNFLYYFLLFNKIILLIA